MISIQDLSFSYHKKKPLFQALSMNVGEGRIIGLLGKNGAGKTTLLKIIAGLLFPQEGRVEVLSRQPGKREPSFLQEVFFIPEDFYLPALNIRNYVRANSPFYPRFDQTTFQRLLGEFELTGDTSISALSHGQKKKLLISFALATKCRLMILDEPTNGLDIPSKATFRQVVAGNLEENSTVIISTHQVKDVENLIDSLLILESGKIIFHGDMISISENYAFSQASSASAENVLFSEKAPEGYKILTRSKNESSRVDLELLFNAITNHPEHFNPLSEK